MNKQIKTLKAAAHYLKVVIIIGDKGLTPAVQGEIALALEAHEMIKIRINAGDKTTRKTMANEIIKHHKAVLINLIGHVVTIYRKPSH